MNYKRKNFQTLFGHLRAADVDCTYVQEYEPFLRDCDHFKAGRIANLIVIGPGGTGKTQNLNKTLDAKGAYTAVMLYRHAFERRDQPLVLDDIETAFRDNSVVTVLKALMEREKPAKVTWNRANHQFQRDGIPFEFETSSRVCLMLNNAARHNDDDVQALLTRAQVVVFDPTPQEVLKYVSSWWEEKHGREHLDILRFCEDNIGSVPRLDCRLLEKTLERKLCGKDWKSHLRDLWGTPLDFESQKLKLVESILKNFSTTKERVVEWKRQTSCERKSWYVALNQYKQTTHALKQCS